MINDFKFIPLGATPSAQRNSGAFTVVSCEYDVNLGVIRRVASLKEWVGMYAWRYTSPSLPSKEKVATWMLDQYKKSL